MKPRGIIFAVTAVLLLTITWWLGAGRRSVDQALTKLEYDKALVAVDHLYEQRIPATTVPPELSVVTAEVRRTEEGVYLVTHHRFVEEDGLFILRRGSTFHPEEHGDPHFVKVRERVYRYHISG